MTQNINHDVYAVHKWRPVTPVVFIEELAQLAMTLDEPHELKAEATTLEDGRTRISYFGYARPLNFEGDGDEVTPCLMQIYEGESGKSALMKRTDVRLNHL